MRICSFDIFFSIATARRASLSLRPIVRSVAWAMSSWLPEARPRSMIAFFTYCCVIEDPPAVAPPARLFTKAPASPWTSMPWCL